MTTPAHDEPNLILDQVGDTVVISNEDGEPIAVLVPSTRDYGDRRWDLCFNTLTGRRTLRYAKDVDDAINQLKKALH